DHLRGLVRKSREKFPHIYHPPNRALFNFRTNATAACVRQACNHTVKREPMLVGATKVPMSWAGSDRSGKPCKIQQASHGAQASEQSGRSHNRPHSHLWTCSHTASGKPSPQVQAGVVDSIFDGFIAILPAAV